MTYLTDGQWRTAKNIAVAVCGSLGNVQRELAKLVRAGLVEYSKNRGYRKI
jgi:hypothetical protein